MLTVVLRIGMPMGSTVGSMVGLTVGLMVGSTWLYWAIDLSEALDCSDERLNDLVV
jgi:hypothetical protein